MSCLLTNRIYYYIIVNMKKEGINTRLSSFLNICKENNIKVTPQRVEIFKEVVKYKNHPSVTNIYQRIKKKFPNISFDTVNRTLQKFVEIGVLKIVEGFEDIRRYDGVIDRHHHFHCIKCFRIIDIYNKRLEDIDIPKVLDEKLIVIDSKIVFEGICNKCKKR